MPACPNGAEPTPLAKDVQRWIDQADVPLAVLGLIQRLWPLGILSLEAALVDYNTLCAANPDPPEPFTVEDFVRSTAFGGGLLGALADPQLTKKIWDWIKYAQFQSNCVCKLAPRLPGEHVWIDETVSVPSANGQVGEVRSYAMSDATYDGWIHPGTPFWDAFLDFTAQTNTVSSNDSVWLEIQDTTGAWRRIADFNGLVIGQPGTCRYSSTFDNPVPPQAGNMRIFKRVGPSAQITGLDVILCAPTPPIPPLPPQDPLTDIPNHPPLCIDNTDLCAMVKNLDLRIGTMALQLSDLQARLIGGDQLVELSRVNIEDEGEIPLVLGTRAVSVELTALGPEAFTSALGRPRGLMRVGSVRWGDGLGYSPRRFIDGDRYDEPRPPNVTSISFQLLAGTSGVLKFLG